MPVRHVVQQGEHLATLALQYGFRHVATVWDAPENEALRATRENPYVLLPGDVVSIPDREARVEEAPTGRRARFRIAGEKLLLRVVLLDWFGKPMAGAECKLALDGREEDVTADGDGAVEREIRGSSREVKLTAGGYEFELMLGHLDPSSERSGACARLAGLGYLPSPDEGDDDDALRGAIEFFQHDYGLTVDGELGDALSSALRDAFGC